MKKIIFGFTCFLIFNLASLTIINAQYVKEKRITRILFIFDASNSMNGQWQSGKKIDIARGILSRLVDSLDKTENLQMALRVYGHQYGFTPRQVCTDSKLEVPFAKDNAKKIREKLFSIVPKGTTPIAYSLLQSGNDFPPCNYCKNIIVLITDGLEECEGDPCKIALMLEKKGISLKPYIIGIGLKMETKQAFECVGEYHDAFEEDDFEDGLVEIVKNALGQTTAQVNLLDIFGKATETDVNMSFYNQETNELLFNSIHTFNSKGSPDTVFLEPSITYKIVVNSIPPVVKENIVIKPKIHNIISIPAPQGFLMVESEKGKAYKDEKFIVRQSGSSMTLNAQTIGQKEKYLTGKYEIEILCLPRLYYNIDIEQSKTTSIKIPEPGVANFIMPSTGFGSLYVLRNKKQEWVFNLNNISKTVLNLQPGNYRAIYRTALAKKMNASIIKDFKVESLRSVVVQF
jgi:Ca-activated chloride channel family protein